MTDNELYHFGVLGMKWGHRKGKVSKSSKQTKGSKDVSKSSKQTKGSKKDISELSDEELRQKVNRMNLERSYNQLVSPKKINRGRQIATTIVTSVVTSVIVGQVVKRLNKGIDTGISKGVSAFKQVLKKNKG